MSDGRIIGPTGLGVLCMDVDTTSHQIPLLHRKDRISSHTWIWCFLGSVLGGVVSVI